MNGDGEPPKTDEGQKSGSGGALIVGGIAAAAGIGLLAWYFLSKKAAQLTLTATPLAPKIGDVVTFTGQLLGPDGKGVSGASVVLMLTDSSGNFVPFATLTTDASGNFSKTLTITVDATFSAKAAFAGDPAKNIAAIESQIVVVVGGGGGGGGGGPNSLILGASNTSPKVGETISFNVKLTDSTGKPLVGQAVDLQFTDAAGNFVHFADLVTDGQGAAARAVKLNLILTFGARAVHGSDVSGIVTVAVSGGVPTPVTQNIDRVQGGQSDTGWIPLSVRGVITNLTGNFKAGGAANAWCGPASKTLKMQTLDTTTGQLGGEAVVSGCCQGQSSCNLTYPGGIGVATHVRFFGRREGCVCWADDLIDEVHAVLTIAPTLGPINLLDQAGPSNGSSMGQSPSEKRGSLLGGGGSGNEPAASGIRTYFPL